MEIYNDDSDYLPGYIYCITNKVNGMQYVGQTIRTILQRWYCHKTESKNINDKTYFHSAIRKYGSDNFDIVELKRISCKSKQELKEKLDSLEQHYISQLNTLRPNGYNLTVGGDTSSDTRRREIAKISKHGELICKYNSISDALRDMKLPDGYLSPVLCGYTKMACNLFWKYCDDLNIVDGIVQDLDLIPYVCKYDKEGNLLTIYDDNIEAGKMNNVGSSRILQCCNGERTNSKGYQYRQYIYKKDILKKINPIKLKYGKGIIQYGIDGSVVNQFKSTKDIEKTYPNFSIATIRSCCIERIKTAYGYVWKYSEVM